MAFEEIAAASARMLVDALRARRLSCRELMQATLARIDDLNPRYNALVSRVDPDDLLDEAARCDVELARGGGTGALFGLPMAPKDLGPVAGLASTYGSRIFAGHVPAHDAPGFARLRAAGAIFVGRSMTPEFGLGSHTYNTLFGATGNAWNPARSAGGSSGGAAVAVATGMLALADGTDVMGSLRNPAGWNHVFGFRPSFGRVAAGDRSELFQNQFGTAGPIARSVSDIALLFEVQAGYERAAPLSLSEAPEAYVARAAASGQGLRIGWLGDLGGHLPMEDGVLAVCRAALRPFTELGCSVDDVQVEFPLEALWESWTALRSWIVAGTWGALADEPDKRALMKPELLWEIEHGRALSGRALWQANVSRSDWFRWVCRLFEAWDFLVLPTAQVWPFPIGADWPRVIAGRQMDTYHRWMEVALPATMAGLPVLAAPAGFSHDGLPIGIQIIGPPRGDRAVLELGLAYEAAAEPLRRPPLVDGGAPGQGWSRVGD